MDIAMVRFAVIVNRRAVYRFITYCNSMNVNRGTGERNLCSGCNALHSLSLFLVFIYVYQAFIGIHRQQIFQSYDEYSSETLQFAKHKKCLGKNLIYIDSCEKYSQQSHCAPILDICTFFCRCKHGYEGKRCEKRTSVNLRPTKAPNPTAFPRNRNRKDPSKHEDLGIFLD